MAGQLDRPYDEAIDVTDDEDMPTPSSSGAATPTGDMSQSSPKGEPQSASRSHPRAAPAPKPPRAAAAPGEDDDSQESGDAENSSDAETSESDDGSEEGGSRTGGNAAVPAGAYNPEEFKGLKVSQEVEELFSYIARYKPHTIELDTPFKPFIPELTPSIGEVDAFLKMPRPDGKPSKLGSVQLDEPTLNPSDPAILDLQLRSLCKAQDIEPMEVRSIEGAEKNPKEIENWIKRIDELIRSKPAPTVQYSRRMPDVEQLMQVWPAEFEEHLQENPLPDLADLDMDLPDMIRVIASILDVPVYNQMTETLHVIFTLYSEFRYNQHFAKAEDLGQDPYAFPTVSNFGQGPGWTESMAPSRAPSPA